ncbi:Bug family tripartite tricarboxylate transporter substrate binding protein [Ottowia thiooxydans]|uniref:Bug family tripartite tricarboxylate transporter substrate binding protein n=1 Tax=Ottowia thiooxydans TaxID=219182 RepID=UPI0004226671|nr:tripartite tricarboxylate transporter substrate binding protein [Ottowia thiooxydans]
MINLYRTSLAVALALTSHLAAAQADKFPTKPIQAIISTAAGSASDVIMRYVGNEATKTLEQPFVIVSKASTTGVIAADFVRRAAPDGYTILLAGNTIMAANKFLLKSLSYDPLKDFEPVSLVTLNPLVLVVRSDLPIKSVAELVAYGKARPGQMNYGIGNAGGRVAVQLLKSAAGIEAQDVAFSGTSQAMLELVAGRLDFMFVDPAVADAFIKQQKIRALAVSSSVRLPSMPELPTMVEAGIQNYDYVSFTAIYAPRGTPKQVIDTLNAAFVKAIDSPDAQANFRRMGMIGKSSTPQALAEFNKEQIASWQQWVKQAGMEAQ